MTEPLLNNWYKVEPLDRRLVSFIYDGIQESRQASPLIARDEAVRMATTLLQFVAAIDGKFIEGIDSCVETRDGTYGITYTYNPNLNVVE